MRQTVFIGVSMALVSVFVLGIWLRPSAKSGATEILSQRRDDKVGSVYVLGRYNGFLNGWDVAFFHKDSQGQWLGYYLAHEVRRWRHVSLRVDGSHVIVENGNQKVAEYDTQSGKFIHQLQQIVYSKADGTEGGVEAVKWGLGDVNLQTKPTAPIVR